MWRISSAAADQLQTLGEEIGVRAYIEAKEGSSQDRKEGVRDAIDSLRDVVDCRHGGAVSC